MATFKEFPYIINNEGYSILSSTTVSMAKLLSIKVVAECVEKRGGVNMLFRIFF